MTDPEAAPRREPRAPRPPRQTVGRGPVIGSAFVHTAAILLAWWTSAVPSQVPDFITFEIELISPPAAELGERTTPPPQELVIETPLDPVPEPQEEIAPALIEEEVAAEEPPAPEQTVAPPDVELVDDVEPPASPNPDPDVETPGEDLNIRMEGRQKRLSGVLQQHPSTDAAVLPVAGRRRLAREGLFRDQSGRLGVRG